MNKKLKWFYRISIWISLILISINILVKALIWSSAFKEMEKEHRHPIHIRKRIAPIKYTLDSKQKIFNSVDYLLRPAFVMLFIILTVKLVKTEDIFKQ